MWLIFLFKNNSKPIRHLVVIVAFLLSVLNIITFCFDTNLDNFKHYIIARKLDKEQASEHDKDLFRVQPDQRMRMSFVKVHSRNVCFPSNLTL